MLDDDVCECKRYYSAGVLTTTIVTINQNHTQVYIADYLEQEVKTNKNGKTII
jgi:hypothetical protein